MKSKMLKYAVVLGIVSCFCFSTGFAGNGTVVLGGYLDVNYIYYQETDKPSSFDMYHFNPIFLYQIEENLLASVELEFEHGGDEIAVEYAQIDYLWSDYVTLTAGKFLVPFGVFNRRLHPGWISKVPGRPLSNYHVVPTGWSETGLMFSGAAGFGENGGRVNYAAYVTNGLEGAPGDDTRDLRKGDPRDKKNNNKAIGGRFGIVPAAGMEFGGSAYTCKYDAQINPELNISFLGFDAEYHHEDIFELRGEYNVVKQDTLLDSTATKSGFYVQASVKLSAIDNDFLMPMELAIRYSTQNFEGEAKDIWELTPTLNYYLSSSTVFRIAYTFNGEKDALSEVDNNVFTMVLAKGL